MSSSLPLSDVPWFMLKGLQRASIYPYSFQVFHFISQCKKVATFLAPPLDWKCLICLVRVKPGTRNSSTVDLPTFSKHAWLPLLWPIYILNNFLPFSDHRIPDSLTNWLHQDLGALSLWRIQPPSPTLYVLNEYTAYSILADHRIPDSSTNRLHQDLGALSLWRLWL